MKAALFDGPGMPIRIEFIADPVPGPDDVVIKVHRCGICGSDVSMTGNSAFTFEPGPLGHEYAGEIVEVGRNVKSVRPGDRVACVPSPPCGKCEGCRFGNPIFCEKPQINADGRRFGGFGEYVALPADGAKLLPQSLSFADGALIEPMSCGLHALRMAAMPPGARLLVLGAGSMALSMVFWARRMGAGRIVVASRTAHRRDLASSFGADAFHSFADDDPGALADALGGPVDIVAECVGKTGFLNRALEHVRTQGTVISLGMCQHHEPTMPAAFTFREARVFFPVGYSIAEFEETARVFDEDSFHPDQMVSDVIALDGLPDALEGLRSGVRHGLKIHVNPAQDN